MWAEHGQCGVNRTRMRKHFVWKNATQSSSPVVCFTLFPHKNGKILKRRCASHCHARVVGASDALLLFIYGPRVVKIEVENAMKCKVFSHAHLVDWSESSYFLFCFVLVFIGTISLTYFFFYSDFRTVEFFLRLHRRQRIAHNSHPTVAKSQWKKSHSTRTYVYHDKIRSYFFYFVGHLPFAFFHWIVECVHICVGHMATVHLSLIKKNTKIQHEPLPGCRLWFGRPGMRNKKKNYVNLLGASYSETLGWH